MSKNLDWRAPVTSDEAARRAAGRRLYNARRTEEMLLRRREVVEMLRFNGHGWGSQAQMARALGVSEATISRDVKAIFEQEVHPCPTCGRVYDIETWKDLARQGKVVLTDRDVEPPCAPTPQRQPPVLASLAALEYLRSGGLVADEDTEVTA